MYIVLSFIIKKQESADSPLPQGSLSQLIFKFEALKTYCLWVREEALLTVK